jgi:ATP-binding cassette subfamily C protein
MQITKQFKRVKTPSVIQMEAVECGAASLTMILAYFHRNVPLEEVRVQCGVSRDGSNAFNILKAAKYYGLDSKAYQLDDESLDDIQLPAIIFWEFNHFLVLEGFGDNKVYLNDPALGPRFVSFKEFKESYAGIVLTFSKGEQFVVEGTKKSLIGLIYERIKTLPKPLSFLFLVGICLLIPGFAFPAFITVFINSIFSNPTIPWKWTFLGSVILMGCFLAALSRAQLYFLTKLNTKLAMQFASEFFWHVLKLPMNFYSQRDSGEIAYRMKLNVAVAESLTGPVISAMINMMLILFFGIAMFFFDKSIATITIIIGIINLVIMYYIIRSRVVAYACLQQNIGKSISQSMGGIRNIETIKSKGVESNFFSRWAGYYTKNVNSIQQIETKDVFLATLPILFQAIALASLIGIGSFRIIEGTLTIGTFMALQILQINFLLPINRFVSLSSILQTMKQDIERLNDVMNNDVDQIYNERYRLNTKPAISALQGKLEFKNVSFKYAPLSPLVVEDISFTIQPGQKIAMIGASGCGKSTLGKLATGLYYPTSGSILYDDMPIESLSVDVFRNAIASVSQDIFIFSGTIRENLSFWNNKVSDQALMKATHDAAIHDEISLREGGYDALLTEEGRNLSGGQRQRLEIARAFLYNPVLLIMDEATSALDNKTEAFVADKINERGCSALIIANRLSTVKYCDEIIVLDTGKISQRGTHDELIKVPGMYHDLVNAEIYDE